MIIQTRDINFMVSGNLPFDTLYKLAVGACMMLQAEHKSALQPLIVKNAPDCIFGNSYDVVFRYYDLHSAPQIN